MLVRFLFPVTFQSARKTFWLKCFISLIKCASNNCASNIRHHSSFWKKNFSWRFALVHSILRNNFLTQLMVCNFENYYFPMRTISEYWRNMSCTSLSEIVTMYWLLEKQNFSAFQNNFSAFLRFFVIFTK